MESKHRLMRDGAGMEVVEEGRWAEGEEEGKVSSKRRSEIFTPTNIKSGR